MEDSAAKFGGWLKSTAASLEGHVKEIRENSKLIAADVASNVKDLEKAGRKIQKSFNIAGNGVLAPGLEEVRLDVTFQQGSLGLNLDLAQGGQILKITPGGQAEALGLRLEDRVVAIGGETLPSVSSASFQEELKKKLSKLPRPVDMSFVRIQQVDRSKERDTPKTPKEKEPKESAEMTLLQAKLDEALRDAKGAHDEAASLAAELQLRKSWAAQESQELEQLRREVEELQKKLEEARKKTGIEDEVLELTSRCRELESRSKEAEERVAQSDQVLAQEQLKCSEAMESLTAARSKEAELQSKLQVAQQALKDQQAALSAEGDEQTHRLQASLLEAQKSQADANLAKNKLEAEILQLTSRCRELESRSKEAEERVAQSDQVLAPEQLKCSETMESLTAARSKEAELQSKLQVAQQALKDQQAALSAEGDEQTHRLQASLLEAQKSQADANLAKDKLQAEILQLTSRCRELESRSREAEERVAQSDQVLAQEQLKCSEAMESLTAARSKEAELQSKLQVAQQALKDQQAALSAEGDEQTHRLQASLLEAQKSQADANLAKDKLEAEILQLTSRCRELESRSKEAEERVAQSDQVLAQEQLKCSEAVESLTAARSKEEKMEETRQLLERQLAETKTSRSELREELRRAEEELEETDTLRRRVEELTERPGEMSERLSKLQSLCGSQREQLRELELERDALREELQKAEVDLQAAVRQDNEETPPVVYGKELSHDELSGREEVADEHRTLLDADEGTRRIAKLQARVGELEAKNASLQRSLCQRPIVYQFAPPDAGIDLEEDAEAEEEQASTASTACTLLHGLCRFIVRRLRRLFSFCRKLKCMSAGETQLRWFTRRLLEKPFLLWVFYLHVLVLWLIEMWRQALSKPMAMDPALTLESAVTKAHLAQTGT